MATDRNAPTASPFRADRPRPPSATVAENLVLVALILQAIGGVILLGVLTWALGYSALFPVPLPIPFAWFGAVLAVGVGLIVVVFLYFAYHLAYVRIRQREYVAAQTPCLVFGVLSLVAGILPGIFYLMAYVKLGDAVTEQFSGRSATWSLSPSGAAGEAVACSNCGHTAPLDAFVACPTCGSKGPPVRP